jgi:hypothetical protein
LDCHEKDLRVLQVCLYGWLLALLAAVTFLATRTAPAPAPDPQIAQIQEIQEKLDLVYLVLTTPAHIEPPERRGLPGIEIPDDVEAALARLGVRP